MFEKQFQYICILIYCIKRNNSIRSGQRYSMSIQTKKDMYYTSMGTRSNLPALERKDEKRKTFAILLVYTSDQSTEHSSKMITPSDGNDFSVQVLPFQPIRQLSFLFFPLSLLLLMKFVYEICEPSSHYIFVQYV